MNVKLLTFSTGLILGSLSVTAVQADNIKPVPPTTQQIQTQPTITGPTTDPKSARITKAQPKPAGLKDAGPVPPNTSTDPAGFSFGDGPWNGGPGTGTK